MFTGLPLAMPTMGLLDTARLDKDAVLTEEGDFFAHLQESEVHEAPQAVAALPPAPGCLCIQLPDIMPRQATTLIAEKGLPPFLESTALLVPAKPPLSSDLQPAIPLGKLPQKPDTTPAFTVATTAQPRVEHVEKELQAPLPSTDAKPVAAIASPREFSRDAKPVHAEAVRSPAPAKNQGVPVPATQEHLPQGLPADLPVADMGQIDTDAIPIPIPIPSRPTPVAPTVGEAVLPDRGPRSQSSYPVRVEPPVARATLQSAPEVAKNAALPALPEPAVIQNQPLAVQPATNPAEQSPKEKAVILPQPAAEAIVRLPSQFGKDRISDIALVQSSPSQERRAPDTVATLANAPLSIPEISDQNAESLGNTDNPRNPPIDKTVSTVFDKVPPAAADTLPRLQTTANPLPRLPASALPGPFRVTWSPAQAPLTRLYPQPSHPEPVPTAALPTPIRPRLEQAPAPTPVDTLANLRISARTVLSAEGERQSEPVADTDIQPPAVLSREYRPLPQLPNPVMLPSEMVPARAETAFLIRLEEGPRVPRFLAPETKSDTASTVPPETTSRRQSAPLTGAIMPLEAIDLAVDVTRPVAEDISDTPQGPAQIVPLMNPGTEPAPTPVTPSGAPFGPIPGALPPIAMSMPDVAPLRSQSDRESLVSPIHHQVAQAIAQVPAGQPGRLELVLTPEDLGSLRFDMVEGAEGTSIVMSAERPETLDLMRRHLPDLVADLRQSGILGGTLSFGQWSERGQNGAQNVLATFAEAESAPTAQPPITSAPRVRSDHGLDLRL